VNHIPWEKGLEGWLSVSFMNFLFFLHSDIQILDVLCSTYLLHVYIFFIRIFRAIRLFACLFSFIDHGWGRNKYC
jgi:hypothetical protein